MGLAEDIWEWAISRPWWQQQALRRLAAGEVLGPTEYQTVAEELLADPPKPPRDGWLGTAPGSSPAAGQQVRLLAARKLANVNALAAGQELTFAASGVTVVYGDNGSGKSGYARLIKHLVHARHREEILTNIFADTAGGPTALLSYSTDGHEHEQQWPGHDSGSLGQVSFYDERCGDSYVTADSEVTYRPSALTLLDSLIAVCDGVRQALDVLVKDNAGEAVALPAVPEGTSAATFLQGVTAATTTEELDAASLLPDHAEEELSRLATEEVRLRASDPTKEQTRLRQLATALDATATEVNRVNGLVGTAAEESLRDAKNQSQQLRAAADVASSASFDEEPVHGVGTQTWRGLWEAARRFSETEAYPERDFPVTGSEIHCPLCQQPLGDEASRRLHRFHSFMIDDTQRQALEAELRYRQARETVAAAQATTPAVAVHLENLAADFEGLVQTARSVLAALGERRDALLSWEDDEPRAAADVPDLAVADSAAAQAEGLRQRAAAVDAKQFHEMLQQVVSQRADLEGRRILTSQRPAITREIARLKRRVQLGDARRQTDTAAITRKSTELTRSHVTSLVQDRFVRESDRLGVERVTLQDAGGRKGQLRQRPAFLGAAVKAELPRVLSEGEQTALGLAGFFTEVYFDETRSALVLDDPVTSLDHLRRALVAKRLAEFARDRQVIVFTHDVVLAGDLRKACEEIDVEYAERSVERRRDGTPGICLDRHPWKARDVAGRLGELRTQLARIKKEEASWDQSGYEKETQDWAGGLSETWERIISLEVVNQVVDRGTLEVKVRMVRFLARITEDDDRELQQSYGRCSAWAKRHDKDPSLSYVAPTVQEMEDELALVKSWFDRVKKYKQN